MPFVTEEMWHLLADRNSPTEALVIARWPQAKPYDATFIEGFVRATDVVTQLRNIRKQNNIPNKEPIALYLRDDSDSDQPFYPLFGRLANVSEVHRNEDMPAQAFTFVNGQAEYAVPFGDTVDAEGQVEKLREELTYTRGFLQSVMKKLGNEKFAQNAPEQVIATERKKQADAEAKIALLQEKLTQMGVEF
jgi:valyl-tRNA synthetase